jgi:isoquinoline 1-oxidoreductase beta subunit
VTFTAGAANVANFNNYRVARMGDMPTVSVKIINSGGPIGGIGELGVPCVAPAIANAYAKLTGKRIRTLPFYPGATMGDL